MHCPSAWGGHMAASTWYGKELFGRAEIVSSSYKDGRPAVARKQWHKLELQEGKGQSPTATAKSLSHRTFSPGLGDTHPTGWPKGHTSASQRAGTSWGSLRLPEGPKQVHRKLLNVPSSKGKHARNHLVPNSGSYSATESTRHRPTPGTEPRGAGDIERPFIRSHEG